MKEIIIFLLGVFTGATIMLAISCIIFEKYLPSSDNGESETDEEDCNCGDNCNCKDGK